MLLSLTFVLITGVLLDVIHGRFFPDFDVVYPKLFESRGVKSEKVLHIREGLSLSLQKSSVLSENFVLTDYSGYNPVVTLMNGSVLERDLYHDKKKLAVVQVTEKDGTVEVRGILGEKLRILPLPFAARSEDGNMAHKVFEVESSADHRTDDIVFPLPEARASPAVTIKPTGTKTIPELFLPELIVIAGYYLWSNFSTDQELTVYVATTIAMANLRFSNAKQPRVQLLLTGIKKVNARNNFQQYIYGKDPDDPKGQFKLFTASQRTLPLLATAYQHITADLVLFITGLRLADRNNTALRTVVEGLAYPDGVCSTKFRFGQAEDVAHTYSMATVVTHELGHLLGMRHDGDVPAYSVPGIKWLNCSAAGGYVMAPVTGGDNEGFFSQCSLQQMRVLISTLSPDCFDVKSRKPPVEAPKKLPGANMSMTLLCERLYPEITGITGMLYEHFSERCQFLCCPPRKHNEEVSCHVRTLVDGMSCGNGKICKRRRCGAYSHNLPPPPTLPTSKP